MVHILDSILLFIHPPLAIIGYIFIIISLIRSITEKYRLISNFDTKKILYISWFFNFTGLTTGMIWAYYAWGSLWSWDPKETITLLIFICISISTIQYNKNKKISIIALTSSIIFIVINILITIGAFGLHSYNIIL